MAKEKAVNYTAEMIETLRAGYTGTDNAKEVEALAAATGKTPASVRAKLASLGLYKAAEKATSKEEGEKVTKTILTDAIGEIVGLAEHEREGLAKATKSALEKVLAKLA